MTDGMNIQRKTKKAVPTQLTPKQAPKGKEIALFGNGSNDLSVPYKDNGPKIPSIFDDKKPKYSPPEIPNKETPIKVPFKTPEMIKEYNEKTVLGVYKGLSNRNITKENTKSLIDNIKNISFDNYKYTFLSFESAGISLTDAIMNSPHLTTKQRQECMNHLLEVGKKTADFGHQRSDDVIPKMKDLIKKYETAELDRPNQKRLTADFKKLVNRTDTLSTGTPKKPNGKIDGTFKQGNTGDCWLLAGIQSLSLTKEGRAVLDKSVKVDAQGNATVTFSGIGKTYKITARDLKCSNELSTGDTDVRAMEIAMDRYFREAMPNGNADIDGNTVSKAFELLGDPNKTQSAMGQRGVSQVIEYIRSTGMKGKASVTGMTGNVDPRGMDATNEKGEKVKMYNGHAYTVKGADSNFVYLINPHDTSSTIKIPVTQYLDKFNLISITDVTGLK